MLARVLNQGSSHISSCSSVQQGLSPHHYWRRIYWKFLHEGKEKYVGSWKVSHMLHCFAPRDCSSPKSPLSGGNNSFQLGWGQILQASPRSPVEIQEGPWPAHPLKCWALSQLSLVTLCGPWGSAPGPCHPSPHFPLDQCLSSSSPAPSPEPKGGHAQHAL